MEALDYNNTRYNQSFETFQKRNNEIRKVFRIKHVITKQEAKILNNPNFKTGNVIEQDPEIPENPKDAFKLFQNYYAAVHFELEKHLFETNKGRSVWTETTIKKEIEKIKNWTAKAILIDVYKTEDLQVIEYHRFIDGYYEDTLMTYTELNAASIAALVYGRYFLFYEFLKEKLKSFRKRSGSEQRNFDPLELIDDCRHKLLHEYEITLSENVSKWKRRIGKGDCAIFMNILFERKYFIPDELKTAALFALSRYDIDCKNALSVSRQKVNEGKTYKKMEAMKRLIMNKPYGIMK